MIALNYRDARPICEQVRDGLRRLMVSGAIEEGEKLPSVRALACSLSINPSVIRRAYDALEREGYLRSEAGRDRFARLPEDRLPPRGRALLRQFDETAAELILLGVTREGLAARLREVKQ